MAMARPARATAPARIQELGWGTVVWLALMVDTAFLEFGLFQSFVKRGPGRVLIPRFLG